MEIRFAKPGDIPGILELLRQVGEVHHRIRPDIFPAGTQKYDEAELLEIFQDEDRPVFVAAEGEFVAGYCFCAVKDYRSRIADRRELYIDDLCVDESRRGSDVASALYRHAVGYAKERCCDFVTLNVWCGNDRAQRFYEKMGLTPRHIIMEMPLEDKEC